MPTPAISLSQVSKAFRAKSGRVQAVSELDLEVAEGEVLGFLGPNGAGKTTTIKMICGLVLPDAGAIRIQGFDVRARRRRAMDRIGAVLEGTRNVYWRLSPWQNLAYAARIKGVKMAGARVWGEILLKELDLWDRRHDPVRLFSRGMQQKTAIACALIHDPPIVLLDEPTLGLDVKAAVTVKRWIQALSAHYRKTLVLTTHQLSLAEELCQRVAIMREGRKAADHAVRELRALHHRRETVNVTVASPADAIRARVTARWPDATFDAGPETTAIHLPVAAQTSLADVAAVFAAWSCELRSLEQAVPSLEDIFIDVTERAVPSDA